MHLRKFSTQLWLPLPPERLFPFFADAGNLNTLTPPWLNFKIITPLPVTICQGAEIDYRLRIHGIPVHWRTCITAWQPPYRFLDEQIRGPYRQWIHEHTFELHAGGTLVRDLVQYAVPFDFLVHSWLVRPDVEKIFAYRAQTLSRIFQNNESK